MLRQLNSRMEGRGRGVERAAKYAGEREREGQVRKKNMSNYCMNGGEEARRGEMREREEEKKRGVG